MARITQAARMDALESKLDALIGALSAGTDAPAPVKNADADTREAVPFLSCWNSAKIAVKNGAFTHVNRKTGKGKTYAVLTREEAVAMVDANIAAGRVYAVHVPA